MGKVLPRRLVRSLRLGDDVRLDYEYTNVGSAPLLAYWCAHPLFRGDDAASAKILHDRARLRWAGLAAEVEMSWDPSVRPIGGAAG